MSFLIKRKIISEIGLFDERYNPAYYEDPDIIFRSAFYSENNENDKIRIGWNADSGIEHRPDKKPSEVAQRRYNFQKSWSEFRLKWAGKKPPILKNNPL